MSLDTTICTLTTLVQAKRGDVLFQSTVPYHHYKGRAVPFYSSQGYIKNFHIHNKTKDIIANKAKRATYNSILSCEVNETLSSSNIFSTIVNIDHGCNDV